MDIDRSGGASVEDLLYQLANGVIAGADDLMAMGECLNLLDSLEQSGELNPSALKKIDRLKLHFNRLILEDAQDPQAEWESIRSLVDGLLEQDADMDDGTGPTLDELLDEPPDAPLDVQAPCASSPSGADGPSCTEIQDPELVRDFIEEAKEHLSSIEINLLSLEANPKDQEAINAVFRPFHSIKGVAGFLNLQDIHHLSHEVENLLDSARSGQLIVTDAEIDIVLTAVDILKVLIDGLEEMVNAGETTVESHAPMVESFLERIRYFQPGSPAAAGGEQVKHVGKILVDRGVVEPEVVEDAAERSKTKGIKIGEELINEGAVGVREVSSALREQRHSKESAASVRIDTHKLDNLVDMIGELVIAQSMVLHHDEVLRINDQKLQKDTVQLRRITSELQRIGMSMRMVPIKSTFQKMIRLVRDLSKKSGKEVVLDMHGEETEIDRNMVEEIYEPLVHMVRNSIDHGIESPEERAYAGKAPHGTVRLKAEQKGGNIVIEIEDDGRGLDAKRIRAKAIERGIISADEQLEDKAIYELVFHAGFSTRDTVTEVSGRGVGMDVVKKSLERLRGKIEISSTLGKGARFEIKLPLTMAIIDGMIISVGHERYVVPTIAMKESLKPVQKDYVTVQGRGEVIKVRNTLMPLVRLHDVFGVEPRCRDPWDGLLLVVNEDGRSYCLLADEIIGRQEVVIKSLGSTLRHVPGISGGVILGDGRVALIIDVKGIVSLYEEKAR